MTPMPVLLDEKHTEHRPYIPDRLEIDTFDGSAWLGVVPFRMSGVRPRFAPALPGVSAFPELNLLTYVTAGERAGVHRRSGGGHAIYASGF